MLALGWWLVPITLFHIIPLYFDAVSWRTLFPAIGRSEERPSLAGYGGRSEERPSLAGYGGRSEERPSLDGLRRSEERPSLDGLRRPGVMSFLWMRWIRESVSSLLPVAGVGGDVVGARLVHQRGVSGAQATASMVVDITVGSATQLVFVLVGVGLLTANRTHDAAATAWGLTAGVAVFAAAIAIFVRIQHNSMFGVLIGWAHRLAPKSWMSGFAGRAEAIDGAVVATYRRRLALSYSSALRLVGWVSGIGEVWLTMWALGKPLTVTDSFILESLSAGVRGAAFMVPGALGAQEGGLVLFGALLGVPPDLALAVSLTKRVRELALGLPGLAAWQWIEGRRWIAGRADKASSTSP